MPTLGKFGFRIRAQNGAVIERILIHAKSEEDGRSKLYRMYPRSEILSSWVEGEPPALARMPTEDVAVPLNA